MDVDSRLDARDTRDGGWSWFQQELLYVFRPLIGTEAAYLYMVMCELVRQKIQNPMMELSIRMIAKASGQSVGTVAAKLAVLDAIGMVPRESNGPGRPMTYRLESLRSLAAVGTDELQRRVRSVQVVNTSASEGASGSKAGKRIRGSQGLSGHIDSIESSAAEVIGEVNAPEATGCEGVHQVNTLEKEERNAPGPGQVFTKPGGSVHETGGKCSPNGGVAFTKKNPFNFNQSIHPEKTPLPPKGGGGGSSPDRDDAHGPVLPWAELHRGEAGYGQSLPIAARWVLAECGISLTRRLETMVVGQLNLVCDETTHTLAGTASAMVESWREYQGLCARQELRIQWGVVQFIGEGLWARPATWPRKAEARSGQVGVATPRDPEAEKRAETAWRESHAAHILTCAVQLEAKGHAEFARRLEPLADAVLQGAGLNELDEELVAIEDALYEHVLLAEPELAAEARAKAEQDARAYAGRMTREQLEPLKQQMLRRRVWEVKDMPRLSFFYMNLSPSVPKRSGT